MRQPRNKVKSTPGLQRTPASLQDIDSLINLNVWEKLCSWDVEATDEANLSSIRADVLTPKEVYDSLLAGGLNVHYVRLPMTDGMAPRAAQFDAIYSSFSLPASFASST